MLRQKEAVPKQLRQSWGLQRQMAQAQVRIQIEALTASPAVQRCQGQLLNQRLALPRVRRQIMAGQHPAQRQSQKQAAFRKVR